MKQPGEAELLEAYRGKRVLVTGHTGFKGGWLTLWLAKLGAEVTGYALPPPTEPSLFKVVRLDSSCQHVVGDVRDLSHLKQVMADCEPDFVFHLAAQSLVRRSYEIPLETIDINVMGTANLLECVRQLGARCSVVIVTSDKCYRDRKDVNGYREDDPLGGRDVYSMSKGATELLVAAYLHSWFPPHRLIEHGVAIASARAGNAIGGGDWARDRIVPDAIRALAQKAPVPVRNPDFIRPWQHVLEPLGGYLLLGARLAGPDEQRSSYCEAWNFGPEQCSGRSVRELVEVLLQAWGEGSWLQTGEANPVDESAALHLNIEKARSRMGWSPRWEFKEAVGRTVDWYRRHQRGAGPPELLALCQRQIAEYLKA